MTPLVAVTPSLTLKSKLQAGLSMIAWNDLSVAMSGSNTTSKDGLDLTGWKRTVTSPARVRSTNRRPLLYVRVSISSVFSS